MTVESLIATAVNNLISSAEQYHKMGLERQARFFEEYALAIQEKYDIHPAPLTKMEPTITSRKLGPVVLAFLLGGVTIIVFSITLTILSDEVVLLHPHVAAFLLIGLLGVIVEVLVAKFVSREQS